MIYISIELAALIISIVAFRGKKFSWYALAIVFMILGGTFNNDVSGIELGIGIALEVITLLIVLFTAYKTSKK